MVQKILHQFLAGIGEYALGVELDSLNHMLPMAQPHDGSRAILLRGPCADFQICRQILFFHDEGVVAGGRHRHRQPLKNGSVVVHNGAGLAMHDVRCPNDVSPKGLADCLMPQTHTQNRRGSGEVADQFDADAGFVGSTRTGRNDDLLGMHVVNLLDRDLVVAAYFDVRTQLSDVLDQVIGKRIVIVENENQKPHLRLGI